MSACACPSPLDRWARLSAWFALLALTATLLWLGLTLFQPPTDAEPALVPTPSASSADLASARSTL
jgi:hypothetical protein